MTTFISILIWIGLFILIILCVRSVILKLLDVRATKKKEKQNDNFEDKEENN